MKNTTTSPTLEDVLNRIEDQANNAFGTFRGAGLLLDALNSADHDVQVVQDQCERLAKAADAITARLRERRKERRP